MRKKKAGIKYNKFVLFVFLFSFVMIAFRVAFLSMFTLIDGIDIKQFVQNRSTANETVFAQRGTVFDVDGKVLAQNVNSYTLIAFLSDKRSTENNIRHVIDKERTARELAPIINMKEEVILNLLNKDSYQVELGPGGRGIGEIKKGAIEKLNLPGLGFSATTKRYYPNNDFASYIIGYAKQDTDGNIIGELGLEQYYNEELAGKNGTLEYQKSLDGYKLPEAKEIKVDEVNGLDIYLTINTNVQFFIEQAIKEATETYDPEWMTIVVADAKTGAILGSSSTPSFDPNLRDIEVYLNPLVSYAYEPGSTMKTYTYMAAIEKGVYDSEQTFESGKIEIYEEVVKDWRESGFGTITYDQGYALSSNVGIANLIDDYLSGYELKSYFNKLGFGDTTSMPLPNEKTGKIEFRYPIEIVTAGFGQGITTTPIQNVRALTSISNNGSLLNPYLIEKIVDQDTGEIIFQGEKTEMRTVASTETINKIKELMYTTVNGVTNVSTGSAYKVEGHEVIGKTGTAQISSANDTGYLTGENDYIYSFAGMYPKADPEIIIYASVSRPTTGGSRAISNSVKQIVEDTAKYYNIFGNVSKTSDIKTVELPSLINKNTELAETFGKDNFLDVTVVGEGNKIINQFPSAGNLIANNEKLILVTNDKNIKMPDMTNWASKDVKALLDMIGIKYRLDGYGFVTDQSFNPGEGVPEDEIIITLEDKDYFEEEVIEEE